MEELLEKKYKTLEKFEMPYCSLVTDSESKERTYRVQITIHLKNRMFYKSAAAEVDAYSGAITSFKEGYSWKNWV